MGKGSRNRQVRTEDKITNPQKYVQKKSAPKHLTSFITLAVVIIVAAAIIFSSLTTGGTLLRMRDIIKSEHFEVTGTMMSYYAHTVYSNYVSQYEQTYSSFLSSYTDYTVYDFIGIDPNESLDKQVMDETTGQTWHDYFMNMAREQVEQILMYCEGAYAAGVELGEEELAEIDTSVQMIATDGTLYGYSTNSYLASLYGTGVREKDVRAAMELSSLASKYITMLSDEYYAAADEDDVNAFYTENETDYLSADYMVFSIDAALDELADDATDADIAAAKAAADEAAQKLMAATTAEEFREAVKAYLTETLTVAEESDETEETEETDETDEIAAEIEETLDAMLVEDYAYTIDTDLGKWVFGEEGGKAAAVNTTHMIVNDSAADAEDEEDTTSTTTDASYSVDVYFLSRAASRDEALTYNAAYLALSSTSYTEEDANAALAAFEAAGADKDALLGLADDYASNNGCTEIENMRPGFFAMDDVDGWVFNTERKAGDYALLTGTSDSTTYYFIVYIESEGQKVWYADCLDDLVVSLTDEWLEEAQKTHPVTVNEKAMANIDM